MLELSKEGFEDSWERPPPSLAYDGRMYATKCFCDGRYGRFCSIDYFCYHNYSP